ncbi:MAG: 4-oxalomesaconate tautomerase [Pseudogulbenkiania sp.]|nr:4-oxalomesaconate tautomerase [Pseudogulbenkiania sp.]
MLIPIPCVVMRGGTSKGPFFLSRDLPRDESTRNKVLLAVMGSPDKRQIDGLGGGDSLSSKVVMVDASSRPGIDVEYLFAQVSVDSETVDTTPNCGNMLSGVAPFAIEHGLVKASMPTTLVRIFNRNTNKVVEAIVETPGGKVNYEGDIQIDGVPGSGAPILLNFLDAAGAKTGKLLPTGNPSDEVDGVAVSCVDFSTPIVFLAAQSVGKTGYETKQELDADAALLARLEQIRLKAAVLMGMGDVSGQVLPKVVLLARPARGGNISSRYFVPWNCHAAHAVTGALCVAAACSIPGTVAAALVELDPQDPGAITIEHPAGKIDTRVLFGGAAKDGIPSIKSAGIVRTAKPIVSGVTYVPGSLWGTPQ